MHIIEKDTYPVRRGNLIVYPEYYTTMSKLHLIQKELTVFDIAVIGVGQHDSYTKVVIATSGSQYGIRRKISIFTGEDSKVSPVLEAFDIGDIRLGVIICREVLHTAIAEIYRMMGVNLLAVSIGGGDFWGLQRESWIDQMVLFSDIVNAPLVCACGADKSQGGLNLIIER